jgi:hypothetical protein
MEIKKRGKAYLARVGIVEDGLLDIFLDGIQMTYAKLIKGHFMSLAYVICMPFKNNTILMLSTKGYQ